MKPPPPQTSADFIANSLAVAPTASGWADVSKAMVDLCEAGDVEAHSCDGRAPMKDPRAPRKPILQFAPSYQRSNGRKVPRAQGESRGPTSNWASASGVAQPLDPRGDIGWQCEGRGGHVLLEMRKLRRAEDRGGDLGVAQHIGERCLRTDHPGHAIEEAIAEGRGQLAAMMPQRPQQAFRYRFLNRVPGMSGPLAALAYVL